MTETVGTGSSWAMRITEAGGAADDRRDRGGAPFGDVEAGQIGSR
jgi:hypothetical protein